jgi:antitoxin component YwqK of YwqJK toxin-antitoxin module
MTRNEHLEFCSKCLNRRLDLNQGLVCNLTGKIADFEGTCKDFNLDETVKSEMPETEMVNGQEITTELSSNDINRLKSHQDFFYATVGGLIATLISALIWAVVTVTTNYQIGYMAIGVGLLVGFTIQFFGAGIDQKFGYLGASFSLLGCLLGNLFSQIGFIAQEQSLGYFETLSYLNFSLIIDILIETFNPIDLLFYGIALYEGYKFAFRRITAQDIANLESDDFEAYPPNYKLRLPLVIVSILLIGFFLFQINKGFSGFKTFNYESGNKMSEGEIRNSKENGKWTYWYENGKIQLTCFYLDGLPDSLWQWFDETGSLSRIGNYKKGVEHGVWINYYANGIVRDSGNYSDGRMNGEWKYRFENGNIYQTGYYKRNSQDSIWRTYYENGQLSSLGEMKNSSPFGLWTNYHENGQVFSKIKYSSDNKSYIADVWDLEGNPIVVNGNGLFKSYTNNGQGLLQGTVQEGRKVGKWTSYFDNGVIMEEGKYIDEIYGIINSWDSKGKQTVKDGQGIYQSYFTNKESIFETGKIENGLREGLWKTYYESTGTIYLENNYSKGKLTGIQKYFFESGNLYSSGEMINGMKEGEWNWYYENGNISSTVDFVNDKKEGKQTMWSETGDKTREENYKNGELISEKIL